MKKKKKKKAPSTLPSRFPTSEEKTGIKSMPQLSPSALQLGNTRRRGRQGSALPPGLLPRLAAPIFCRLLIPPPPPALPLYSLFHSFCLGAGTCPRGSVLLHIPLPSAAGSRRPPLAAHPRVGHRRVLGEAGGTGAPLRAARTPTATGTEL